MKNKKTRVITEKRERMTVTTIVLMVLLIAYAISLFIPLIWGFITSFKGKLDFLVNVVGLPKEWVWNFEKVYEMFYVRIQTPTGAEDVGVGMMFVYGFLYAIGSAFCATLVPCITAYLCARFPYKFSKVIYTTVIVVMIIPIVGSLPAEMNMARRLGLYDTIWGIWLMKANFLGMYFLVFYAAFKSLPNAYSEAARIDGAGNFTILFRVMLPLVKNTFFTVMLINFITFWNDYQTPLVYLPSYPTIAVGMYEMSITTVNGMSSTPMRMAGSMMMLIPILIIFIRYQKRLLGNLTVGGVKG